MLRAEMAAALAEKEFQMRAMSERGGSELLSQQQEAARALAEALEAEKEKRIAHLTQMAVKRMLKAGLTKGWQTWLDMYLEHQRQKRMLAAAAGRLMKPALAAALSVWRDTLVLTLTLSPTLSLALALPLSLTLSLSSCGATSGGRSGSASSTRGRRSC